MIPPKPEFNAAHTINEDGISRPLNIYQRIEAKLDHLIECAHAGGQGLCRECFWAIDAKDPAQEPQEVS